MNDIVKIEEVKIPEVFIENGLQPYLDKIKKEVSTLVPDLSTDKGRKEIASLAHRVAKSKTYLDGQAKKLYKCMDKFITEAAKHRAENEVG